MSTATTSETATSSGSTLTPARIGLFLGPAIALAMLWLAPPEGLSARAGPRSRSSR